MFRFYLLPLTLYSTFTINIFSVDLCASVLELQLQLLFCSVLFLVRLRAHVYIVECAATAQHLSAAANYTLCDERALDDIEPSQEAISAIVHSRASYDNRKHKYLPRQTSVPCTANYAQEVESERTLSSATSRRSRDSLGFVLPSSSRRRMPPSSASFAAPFSNTVFVDANKQLRCLSQERVLAEPHSDSLQLTASELYSQRKAMRRGKQSSQDALDTQQSVCVDPYFDIAGHADIGESTLCYQVPASVAFFSVSVACSLVVVL